MFCRKCGNEVQNDWVACPKCGATIDRHSETQLPFVEASQPQEPKKRLPWGAIIIAALVFLTIYVYIVSNPTQSAPAKTSQPSKKQVLMIAEVDTRSIVIVNGNDFDWVSPNISIWAGMSAYNIQTDTIKAKEKRVYLLSDFTNGNKRFDGRSTKPDKVLITTDTAAGGIKLQ